MKMADYKDVGLVAEPLFLKHRTQESHPENPDRIAGLLDRISRDSDLKQIPRLGVRSADENELLRIHSREMVKKMQSYRGTSGWLDPDTYYSSDSIEVALGAAGATIDLALKIWQGELRRGFSLVRPPGHHAVREEAMGFCLFNNIALATSAILDHTPSARLAIIDFDLHHGNGTQWSFYDNPQVLFLSSHRFPYYPGTGELTQTGKGAGVGTSVNFPVGSPLGDAFFEVLYGDLVPKILSEFKPDMLLVSAGYDGHAEDPMQGFQISTQSFGYLTRKLIHQAEKAQGKILFCLEGGYNPRALSDCVVETLSEMGRAPRLFTNNDEPQTGEHALVDKFKDFYRAFFPGVF
jgi:acetoin utilization deacetylase AcuC-like enzyme